LLYFDLTSFGKYTKYFQFSFSSVGKKWLFWFLELWLVCRQKPNVPFAGRLFTLSDNVLQLPEGGDFEALHFQPSTNLDSCSKLDLTTEPPLLGRCCYGT